MLKPQLITGNRSFSHRCLPAWLLLREFGLSYTEIRIDLLRGKSIEELGLSSPSLQLPVLEHGSIKVWDPLPICEYLNETFLEGRAWPSHQKKRAVARSICAELHADFSYFWEQWPLDCHHYQLRQPDARLSREIARLDSIMQCCRRQFGDGGCWLLGKFSIVDSFLAPFAITLESYGAVLTQPAREYQQALLAHPEVQNWLHEAEIEHGAFLFQQVS
jgi:glutathione S-transferase